MSNPNRRKMLAVLGVAVVLVAAIVGGWWFWQAQFALPQDRKIRIGVPIPLSGSAASAGVGVKEGTLMAIEEWNQKGGIYINQYGRKLLIDPFIVDDQALPEVAVSVCEKLITRDKVDMIAGGPWDSTPGVAVMELAAKYGIAWLSGQAMTEEITKKIAANPEKYWSFYKPMPNGTCYGIGISNFFTYLIESKLWEPTDSPPTIAFILEDSDWGRSNSASAIELLGNKWGFVEVAREIVTIGTTDFYPVLSKIKNLDPDIVFISGIFSAPSGVACVKQFHELGLKSFLYSVYWQSIPEAKTAAGAAMDLLYGAQYPLAFQFAQKYGARFPGQTPSIDAQWNYEFLQIALSAIERAASLDSHAIVDELKKTDYQGFVYKYAFDPLNHEVKYGPGFMEYDVGYIKTGKEYVVYPVARSTSDYIKPTWVP